MNTLALGIFYLLYTRKFLPHLIFTQFAFNLNEGVQKWANFSFLVPVGNSEWFVANLKLDETVLQCIGAKIIWCRDFLVFIQYIKGGGGGGGGH